MNIKNRVSFSRATAVPKPGKEVEPKEENVKNPADGDGDQTDEEENKSEPVVEMSADSKEEMDEEYGETAEGWRGIVELSKKSKN